MFRLVALSFAIAVVLCPNVAVRADEISGTIEARAAATRRAAAVETLFSDWLKAARDCKSYDAKFTRWEYDPVFGDRTKTAKVAEGRILFQRGGPSRYDIPNDECWLWQGNEISEIDWNAKTHRRHGPLDPAGVQMTRTEFPLTDFFG